MSYTQDMLSIFLQIFLGLLVADLISALVHLTVDKLYGTRAQHWPFLGNMICEFKEHHDDPSLMLTRSFWASSKETIIASSLAIGFAFLGLPWFWGTVALGTALCQEAHKCAHRKNLPKWIRVLQRTRILIPKAVHAGHHNGTFDRNFGILNGWSNPILNPILSILEKI